MCRPDPYHPGRAAGQRVKQMAACSLHVLPLPLPARRLPADSRRSAPAHWHPVHELIKQHQLKHRDVPAEGRPQPGRCALGCSRGGLAGCRALSLRLPAAGCAQRRRRSWGSAVGGAFSPGCPPCVVLPSCSTTQPRPPCLVTSDPPPCCPPACPLLRSATSTSSSLRTTRLTASWTRARCTAQLSSPATPG